ncbi:MAG: hypothetical protein ABIA92_04460 [Patescibacteria group bacterium]
MLFDHHKDWSRHKTINLDHKHIDLSPFKYSVYQGVLWAENKEELIISDEKTSWSPTSLKSLDLDKFPLIKDFYIEMHTSFSVYDGTSRDKEEISIHFRSRDHGVLFTTSDYMTHYLNPTNTSIPSGTIEKPYHDSDQSYNVVIFHNNDHVYMLSGNDDEHDNLYSNWFKVPKETYATAWLNVKKWAKIRLTDVPSTFLGL